MKIAEVRKNKSDQIEIRMEGQETFRVVDDPEIAAYCVYVMLKGPQAVADNNSMIAGGGHLPERLRGNP